MDKEGDKARAIIWKVALVLFVQRGFRDITTKGICEVAGLNRGGLYTHYGSIGQVSTDTIDELMSGLKSRVVKEMGRDLSAVLILDELLERYQSEMLDRSGSSRLAFYKCHGGMPLLGDNTMLEQYYTSKTMLCSLTRYGIDKSEFKQASVSAVADLLLFSYQDVRMLSSIMPLDDDNIPKDMIGEVRTMLIRQKTTPEGEHG